MGGIEFLEFLRIAAYIRVIELGQLLIGPLDRGNVAVGEKRVHFDFEQLHALSFRLGQPGTPSFVGSDGIGGNGPVVVPLQEKQGRVASGRAVVDEAIPLSARLEDKSLQIIRRFFSVGSAAQKPGDLSRPNRKDIEHHEIGVKRKGGVARVEGPQQPFGQGEDPEHLLPALLAAVASPCADAGGSTGKALFLGAEVGFGHNERSFWHGIKGPVIISQIRAPRARETGPYYTPKDPDNQAGRPKKTADR